MLRVLVKATLMVTSSQGDEWFEPRLLRLLEAIHQSGKLTVATRQLGLSYRYAWELLNQWRDKLGAPLVLMERGRGARLSSLGEKFLWAERRIESSLFPRLENVAAELNAEINKATSPTAPKLRLHASHGYAVARLPGLSKETHGADIELQYMGSVDALNSLARGQCDLAGFHVPNGDLARAVWGDVQFARPVPKLIRLVLRNQGLMTTRGNPLGIRALKDLCRRGVRLVNRQPGSATRLLFDALLAADGIDPKRIAGYESWEFTHAAVAAFIASGAANVGLGVEPAARQFKLDFIPITTERYMLACNAKTLMKPEVKKLRALLSGSLFKKAVGSIPGDSLDNPGEVVGFGEAFPWLSK